MSKRSTIAVHNGRLLPDDSPVDFVLWVHDRDFEIVEEAAQAPESRAMSAEAGSERDGAVAGWFFAPDLA